MSPSEDTCNPDVFELSSKEITARILRTNAVLVVSLIIVVILVGAGSFSRRYRRHGSIRLLFLGAYTVFVPLVSYVVSGVHQENCKLPDGIKCSDESTSYLLVWASLVQIVGANYCTAIAPHDDEPRNIGPTLQLLLGAIWTLFLILQEFIGYSYDAIDYVWIVMPCGLSLAKILAKLYAYEKARRSFELGGHNPRLIGGYMEQLNFPREGDEHVVVPLILTGEDKQKVEEGPRGYRFTCESGHSSTLVSMDRVANVASNDHSWRQYEDLCLSFSLFKLLRQRFTRCLVVKADYESVPNFKIKLQQSEDAQGIVSMIVNELSFACDFYYSYLPISYSSWWLPILNVVLSFLVIAYCIVSEIYLVKLAYESPDATQIYCQLSCGGTDEPEFGYILVLDVLTTFLAIAVLLSEAWVIISYTCSNWTKVKLICYYITKTSRQGSRLMKRLICCMLRFRCEALNDNYKMGQTSIMDNNMVIVKAVRRLFRLPDQMKYEQIKPEVNTAILDKFRASNWTLPTVTETLQQSPIGNNILWVCSGKGTSDVILVWHIATCIFEIKHPYERTNAPAVTASQLSKYCAYLLSSAPELLPDDKAWSKKLYKSVKTITEPIFSIRSNVRPMQYDRILQLLGEKCSSNRELNNGVALGKQLVDETQGAEQEGWDVLAGFWSAMVLYIAPSDNVGAHQEAIARGGELITILWAMLTHAGIISRPRTGDAV